MNQLTTYLMRLCGLAFILLYLVLVFNNRFAADDYHVIDNIQKHGIWGSVKYEYESWSGRWSATLLSHAATTVAIHHPFTLPWMQLTIGILFSVSLFMLLKNSGLISFDGMSRMDMALMTATATAILFLATINKGDTWMWWCASFTYLLGMTTIMFGIGLVLDEKKDFWKDIFCCIAFIYAGGASEPAAAATLILMGLFGVWSSISKRTIALIKHNKSRLIIGVLALGVSFAVCMLAPGHEIRSSFFPQIGITESFLMNFKMLGLLVAYKLILPFTMFLMCVPALLFSEKEKDKTKTISNWKVALGITLSLSLVFIFQWAVTKATSDIAADRALLYVLVIMMLTIVAFYKHLTSNISTLMARLVSLLILATILSYHVINQYTITKKYAEACDERIQLLDKTDQQSPNMTPLPNSGFLYSAEISSDSTHHTNKHLREGLNLDFTPVATQKTR
ncbi:MAG: DUF6056 family protein [Bacteroidota bacterium]